jgi:hypothetical protein
MVLIPFIPYAEDRSLEDFLEFCHTAHPVRVRSLVDLQ